MKKVAVVFVLAVLFPSLVLAWLAVRSLRDQQFVLERQQSLICQSITDRIAGDIEALLVTCQHDFGAHMETLFARASARQIAATFDQSLQQDWPLAKVGFVVTTSGELLNPPPASRPEARSFCSDNGEFLTGKESAEVYWNNYKVNVPESQALLEGNMSSSFNRERSQVATDKSAYNTLQNTLQSRTPQARNIQPLQKAEAARRDSLDDRNFQIQELSRVAPTEAEFKQLIGDSNEGLVARFVNNKLNVLFWHRSPREPQYIFGAQIDLSRLTEDIRPLLNLPPGGGVSSGICLAVLDDAARPVALSREQFQAAWKHPFVATELGEMLPHWEVAAYLVNPARLTESARTIRLTLGLLVALLLFAIGVGSWLIARDLNRQLSLARQKTDFVSNVSHELKTPLTSIRMFSELLAEGRITDPSRQRSYLNIITAETARLTRLINNVLDFSRMERGEKKYQFRDCDLVELARESIESYRPHLENNGFQLAAHYELESLSVRGDCDALAQVIVNLLSNAEKYSNDHKEIEIRVARRDGPLPCAELKISDRGLGVPRGSEEKIFEKFYRAHDSLGSGIQGSGLGLTLARQIARAHGGDISYEPRPGGGSSFCLRLPLHQPA